MPVYKVSVKWGKEKYSDVEVSTEEAPLVFKAQLFALTGVQPERQKVGAIIVFEMLEFKLEIGSARKLADMPFTI